MPIIKKKISLDINYGMSQTKITTFIVLVKTPSKHFSSGPLREFLKILFVILHHEEPCN